MNDHFEEKGKPWNSFDFIYSGMWGIININSINYSFWYTLQFLHFKRTQISLSYLFKTLLKNLYFWIWNITSQWMLFFLNWEGQMGLCAFSLLKAKEKILELQTFLFVYSSWPPTLRVSPAAILKVRSVLHISVPYSLWFSGMRGDGTIELGYW